jgi:hypothetical protein
MYAHIKRMLYSLVSEPAEHAEPFQGPNNGMYLCVYVHIHMYNMCTYTLSCAHDTFVFLQGHMTQFFYYFVLMTHFYYYFVLMTFFLQGHMTICLK